MSVKKYKYELHCHTAETSKCASAKAEDVIKTYKEKGYDGVVITDHYSAHTFFGKHFFSPQKSIDTFLKGYNEAKKYADENFTVLLGMELRYYATINDFLVFGITEDFLKNSGNLLAKSLKNFFKLADSYAYLVIEAHPCRIFRHRADIRYIHGCEIYNGKGTKDKENAKAEKWAKESKFSICTSGSDFHSVTHTDFGGIETDEQIKTNEDLLRILKSGNFRLIRKGKTE